MRKEKEMIIKVHKGGFGSVHRGEMKKKREPMESNSKFNP